MNTTSYSRLAYEGLWANNPGFVQILGLCPLLAVSSTMANALGLGLATTFTLIASNVIVSLIRRLVPPEIRIPVFVLVISCVVTIVDLGLQAYFYPLHHVLGIFIPLIVTNCIIIGRAEAFAFKNSVVRSFADGLAMGMGFLLVLVLLGALREVLGHGTLFREAHLMFGEGFQWLTITLLEDYRGLLLAVLPPGAFIGLGLLIAAKNAIDSYRAARLQAVPKLQPAG